MILSFPFLGGGCHTLIPCKSKCHFDNNEMRAASTHCEYAHTPTLERGHTSLHVCIILGTKEEAVEGIFPVQVNKTH